MYAAITPSEVIIDQKTNQRKYLTYIGGDAYTAPIAYVRQPSSMGESGFMYLHRDHLGSIIAITNSDGEVIEKTHYSAWGEVAEYWDAKGNDTLGYTSILGRGYTGHEHFNSVSLIHMNGRMYDAKLRRFLSPDNFIQDPFNTQSFNRYGYVWNNPLKYNDPSGELLITAMLIGAAVGVLTNGINNTINGQGFFEGAGSAALFGAISGAVSFGIGNLGTSLLKEGVNKLVVAGVKATLHGLSGATMSMVQGGGPQDALAGFASGFIGSAIASGVGGLTGQNTVAMIASAGLGGGIAAEISGGKFADGFRNGVIAAGLNHALHKATGPPDKARQAARAKKKLAKQAVKTADAVNKFVENNGGTYKSVSLTGIVGGGLGLEFGYVTDSTGATSLFFTISGHVGLGGGFGFNSGIITPTRGQQF